MLIKTALNKKTDTIITKETIKSSTTHQGMNKVNLLITIIKVSTRTTKVKRNATIVEKTAISKPNAKGLYGKQTW